VYRGSPLYTSGFSTFFPSELRLRAAHAFRLQSPLRTSAAVAATPELDLQQLTLKSGTNSIEVAIEAKAEEESRHSIAMRSQLEMIH
jgi:hypothetical protein